MAARDCVADVQETRQTIVASPSVRVDDMTRKLTKYRIGYLAGCDEMIVGDDVFIRARFHPLIADRKNRLGDSTESNLITPDPTTCKPDDESALALRIMNQRSVRHISVIKDREPSAESFASACGIIAKWRGIVFFVSRIALL